MSLTLQISDESAALLAKQAAEHGLSVDSWIEELAREKALASQQPRPDLDSIAAGMRAIRERAKPDPEGWTIRDYINYGRR